MDDPGIDRDRPIGDNTDWTIPVYAGGNLSLNSLSIGRESLIMLGGKITCTSLFELTGRFTDGGTIEVAGSGTINCSSGDDTAALGNSSTLSVTGRLAVTGPGTFAVGGGACRIVNNGTISFVDAGLDWVAGTNPVVENNGQIDVLGTVVWTGGDVRNHGTLTVPARSSLEVGGTTVLRLVPNGHLAGEGTLTVGNPVATDIGATLSVEADSVVPKALTLRIVADGLVATRGVGAPNPPGLQIEGTLVLGDGVLEAWTTLVATATCSVTGRSGSFYGGRFQNLGTITVAPNRTLTLTSGITLLNAGRIELRGGSRIVHSAGAVTFDNRGLVVSSGSAANTIDALTVESTGNIQVHDGILDLVDETVLSIRDGTLDVRGAEIRSSDRSARIEVLGGTTGGVLRGHGQLGADVVNRGMVEPDGTGLAVRNRYEQAANGALVLVRPGDDDHPPLTAGGTATLSGSVFVRGD